MNHMEGRSRNQGFYGSSGDNIMAAKLAYTAEQSAQLVAAYTANPDKETVEAFALSFGKTVKSIIAKLSREGVYKKAEYVSKSGNAPIKKETIADELQELFKLTEAEADSLTKANKTALNKILAAYKVALADVMANDSDNESE